MKKVTLKSHYGEVIQVFVKKEYRDNERKAMQYEVCNKNNEFHDSNYRWSELDCCVRSITKLDDGMNLIWISWRRPNGTLDKRHIQYDAEIISEEIL
jgi:hypothetical protein